MNDQENNQIRIETPKGRPLLNWVGKKPIEYVRGFPTQLIEVYDPENVDKFPEAPKYSELEKNWHNLLFHGDNKEVLATLLELGYRGKIDLIYIDPPFASNKDYVRKVELRGLRELGQIEEDSESIIQQTMYEDIWKRDEYFQFMYERLILLKEMLKETGNIYVHLDYNAVHYVKIILDEVFGQDNFINEIIWCYTGPSRESNISFSYKHQTILRYSKSDSPKFDLSRVRIPYKALHKGGTYFGDGIGDKENERYIIKGKDPGDWWEISPSGRIQTEYAGFNTQKPLKLLERIIDSSTDKYDLVLDCFVGSGTTCVASQKLGRRWIGVDINNGAIQLTSKLIQQVMNGQYANLIDGEISKTFAIYKVNNYDLKILKTEAKELAIQQYGITKLKTDSFFDGIRDKNELVKIIDFNHLLTLLDLQLIVDELNKRPDEDRDIVVISLGRETKIDAWVEEWNKKQPYKDTRTKKRMRQFLIFDLKDKNFVSYEPSKAELEIKRVEGNKVNIKITSFISPTIITRLQLEPGLLQKKIPDFRSMIDVVLIDTNYNDDVFRIVYSDIPEKKYDLISGEYNLEISNQPSKIAVKIIDMLGEEVLITQQV